MWQKNNGSNEPEIIQNQFTAYLTTAVQRRRNDYILRLERRRQIECLTDDFPFMPDPDTEQDMLLGLPILMQIEDSALLQALKELGERERYIFLERTLEGKSFEVLAQETGLSYKGIAAVYYRAVEKIKRRMEAPMRCLSTCSRLPRCRT